MAFVDTHWYVNSVAYAAVTAWAQSTAKSAGALIRQAATPTQGNERVFVALNAGTTKANPEPTWTVTRGAKNTDNDITWQEITGAPAVCGDVINTRNWNVVKNTVVTLGQVIKNVAATHYFIASTGGTAGNGAEPTWSTTTGTTTADNTVTWTCIGAVGAFGSAAGPHQRLVNALASTWSLAGQTIYIGNDSAENLTASMTLTGSGTLASPIEVVCHNSAGNYPPQSADVTTGAVVQSGSFINISAVGLYVQGVTFKEGASGAAEVFLVGNANDSWQRYDNCFFDAVSATGASGWSIKFGSTTLGRNAYVELNNTNFRLGNATGSLIPYSVTVRWRDTATPFSTAGGGVLPTTMINGLTNQLGTTVIDVTNVDLSALSGTLVGQGATNVKGGVVRFANCKLHASVTISATLISPTGISIDFHRCDSANTNYHTGRVRFDGTETEETTIVRTGGGGDGTILQARKLVTNANACWMRPLRGAPISIWNDAVGSPITITMYGIWGGGAVPNNDDVWFETEYLGASGSPLGSLARGTKANGLATGTAHASDSSTWGGSTTKFKMTQTITPQKKGWITVIPKAGRASSTFYLDPQIELS